MERRSSDVVMPKWAKGVDPPVGFVKMVVIHDLMVMVMVEVLAVSTMVVSVLHYLCSASCTTATTTVTYTFILLEMCTEARAK